MYFCHIIDNDMSEEKEVLKTTFFDRLQMEHNDLMEKHIRLVKFLSSVNKDEQQIPEEELILLKLQEMTMKQYGYILERRINLITKRLKNDIVS